VSDPFQILVGDEGPLFTIADVGYGVSQVLPILVEAIRADDRSTFLLQQPEVHLHPRAQAALASLFASLANAEGKCFCVETHSDYILDRVRMDVRDGKGVTADDVIILYFEKGSEGVNIHPIHIDESGNILDPPKGYRSFFMQEEQRYFGG
jgi:predicted ATPase